MVNKKKPEVGSAEDRKLIQHYADEIKKTVDSLGGEEEAQRRLELSTSIFYYHTLARKAGVDVADTKKTVEYILQLFREAIEIKGYKGLKPNMIPVVYYYGTLKDQAALCIQYFDYNRWERGHRPPINKRTIDSLRDRIRKTGLRNLQDFVNYLAVYDAYMSVTKHLFYVVSVYFAKLYQTALYIQNYEWTIRTAHLLKEIEPLIKEESKKHKDGIKFSDFGKAIDTQNDYLENNQLFGHLRINDNGTIEDTEADDCLDYATESAKQVYSPLSTVKGMIEGLREWTKEQEGNSYKSILMPQELRSKIIAPDLYTSTNMLPDKYFVSNLQTLQEQGKEITDNDKKIAILPSYDDVAVDEDMKNQTIGQLNDKLQEGQNRLLQD